ncbi:MAG: GDP-mannose 4,6-dehydratase [Candidatus Staskawiczbacteria bacterium RIFOXYD2_FULL_37_9]|uniref:GDP-mannose 4,6-dehydratase n=1 Tax=Candidatus Staskawiczbacteria bacterium RIFOXYB1_FULL_37_44 TaxID=1802223 RepID=A0A1G2IXN4_9BACT|nr:MAG: GDP-mannose 4,6-dehydratase [Candidatus Staskawiczbacteria bacterium RIFOXYB1_FULL_37_44]OGZ83356.1 MAG: GDP-mannose 4,6-dehydratase [Candidatus Staskawiczbacteria bacterium RIFOXYC1_FULL_37_52]OGZ88759.1 MAG: GDP-mannose 4,6-dehydratase [Candidatus Staskawiczbacteria bacterium RIFOXYD1_FULL_37_110]OGZ89480.1 MAG: GDP-mannose 4,6-dehydratase [Candidatus Staskawiczbacteria bacterium RIFOXYC2_FULL_37_19]OGZ93558.1 MAG: GDP-mannose 4,6-dehydratase [Candidatus Staskawiczbacteria bacterium R
MVEEQENRKKALITGITGQDGSYLAEFLIYKGYEVHGIIRRASTFNTQRIDHIYQDPHANNVRLFNHYGDLTDAGNLEKIINQVKPDEIYHLGAQSHVRVSFDMPEFTSNTVALGTLRILEAIKNSSRPIKFYNAASSEMFGSSNPPQNEETIFHPRSPYAAAKVFSYEITRVYRESYGIFACNGILFNHESPRRGETFVTRKITRAIAIIKAGLDKKIYLGNLDAKRDWGYSPEYIEAMHLMLQQDKPADYVIGTGETHTVKEFLEKAFEYSGLGDWQNYVEIDPAYFRPAEVEVLIADAKKSKKELSWTPKIKFDDLVKIMVDSDMRALKLTPPGEGDKILKEKFSEKWWRVD